MRLVRHDDGWRIEGIEPFTVDGAHWDEDGLFNYYGPYPNRKQANEDKQGIKRFLDSIKDCDNT